MDAPHGTLTVDDARRIDAIGRQAVAAGEFCSANVLIARLVDVMRRRDPVFAAAHGATVTADEAWDEALLEAEDWLDERRGGADA
jgi:hypothetical protein